MAAEDFGGRLRQLREAAGLTQQELADRIGVRWGAISRWERGDREPGWSMVLALGKALGVPCTAFEAEEESRGSAEQPRGPGRPRKAGANWRRRTPGS